MAQLELQVLDWLREAVNLPAGYTGVLTTGGSMANLAAIAAARTHAGDPATATVHMSAEAHYSLAKAARVLGIPANRVRRIAVDDRQRLRPEAARASLQRDRAAGFEPIALCATAGTTSTGAIDPLVELAEVCAAENTWLHVDAAWGGAAALLAEHADAFAGLGRADSITLDPHKWLYAPFECGCLLTRRPDALTASFTADGEYMQDVPRDEVNFFERGPELSRGNRALKLWTLLRTVGTDAIAACIREDIRLCRLARDLLAEDRRVQIVTEPSLAVFSFCIGGGEARNRDLLERILADGFLMLSSSRVASEFVLRFCVVNHRTTELDIRQSVARVLELID
jgi:glutamate/tyrosine decarboxylase-like PLP-dependent enzyme